MKTRKNFLPARGEEFLKFNNTTIELSIMFALQNLSQKQG